MNPVTVILWLGGACALAALVGWAVGTQFADDRLAYLDDDEVPS
jgi:hypothetical protein